MSFTPASHAAWSGELPLRGGLAIEKEEHGSLGLAILLGTATYYTAARHVVGRAPQRSEPTGVFRIDGNWQTTDELQHLNRMDEPGAADLLHRHDLALLKPTPPARNVTPDGRNALAGFGVAVRGSEVWLRGVRHEDWVQTIYRDDFAHHHEQFFTVGALDREHLGVVDLKPLGLAHLQGGNSGSVIWERSPDGCFALGHLVAVSFRAPLGLVVLYRGAFRALGLESARVVEEVAVV